ncbi:hypothetical protein RYX36_019147, partial [Vicia faba]
AASSAQKKVITEALVLDNILSSSSPCLKSPSIWRPKDGLGSWSTLFQRHRFLLSALAASSAQKKVITEALVLDNILSSSSPRLKSPSIRRPKDGLGRW